MGSLSTIKDKITVSKPIKYIYDKGSLQAFGKYNGEERYAQVGSYGGGANCEPINQYFGENTVPFYSQMGMKGHNGIDWTAITGTYLYSPIDGIVTKSVNNDPTRGNYVKLESKELDYNGNKVKLQIVEYHLLDTFVKDGQEVKRGELIGICDNTGEYTTGAHLHEGFKLALKSLNWQPEPNSYGGCFDHYELIDYPKVKDKKYMIQILKEKNSPHYWLVGNGKKKMIVDFQSYQALLTLGFDEVQEVDDLSKLTPFGTFIDHPRVIE